MISLVILYKCKLRQYRRWACYFDFLSVMHQVYDRSQEWTDENSTCPLSSSPSAVQDAKEVIALRIFVFFRIYTQAFLLKTFQRHSKKVFFDSVFFKFIIVEYSLFVTYFFERLKLFPVVFVSGKHTILSLIMFVYSLCVWRKTQRTVIYLSGVLVSVVDVVIIDIRWLVFNVFSRKESWMYLLAFYLTTKAITENSMFFVLLKLYLVKILLTSLRVNCKLFIWRY